MVKQYGSSFEPGSWRDLFSVLFRIFDLKVDRQSSLPTSRRRLPPGGLDREWMDTTCNHALYAMTDVFNEFFPRLAPILLQDMLAQYKWCLRQDNDQLARSAVACIENLVVTNRPLLSPALEVALVQFLADVVRSTAAAASDGGNKSATAIQVRVSPKKYR